jgi:tetratricopeptide (TPR) repeat protein
MPRALTTTLLGFTALVLATTLSGCNPRKAGTESASATTDSSSEGATAKTGAIPITAASDEARSLYLEGRALSEQLKAHDGRAKYEAAVAKDPSFAMGHYQLAVNAATAKDFFAHLKEAVALSDKASEGERLTILALEAGGNAEPAKALEYQRELAAKYPNDERAHFLLATGLFGQQDFESSIAELRKATEINPNYSPAYNQLGYAYRQVEKYDDAATAFKKYIELIPNDPNPYDSYAELLMKTGRFDESIAQYGKALSIDPHFGNSRIGIATNLMYQGKTDQAAAEAQKLYDAARDDGDRRFALFTRAVIYTDAGRTAAALTEAGKEFAIAANHGDSANMSADALLMGNILLHAGRNAEAAKRFQQSLDLTEQSSLSPDVKEDARLLSHFNTGRVALARGDLAAAKEHSATFTRGAEERHNTFRLRQAHELAGNIALGEKNFDSAIGELSLANQQDPQVLYAMALAYRGKGDAAKAKELAARAANDHVLPLLTYAFVRAKAKSWQAT